MGIGQLQSPISRGKRDMFENTCLVLCGAYQSVSPVRNEPASFPKFVDEFRRKEIIVPSVARLTCLLVAEARYNFTSNHFHRIDVPVVLGGSHNQPTSGMGGIELT